MEKESKIAIFQGKRIRRHWDAEKELWYFSVVDVVGALTNSENPRKCWNKLNVTSPSPNAEPFKLWLARVGYERLEETADPELAINRALKTYLQKGYSQDWINQFSYITLTPLF